MACSGWGCTSLERAVLHFESSSGEVMWGNEKESVLSNKANLVRLEMPFYCSLKLTYGSYQNCACDTYLTCFIWSERNLCDQKGSQSNLFTWDKNHIAIFKWQGRPTTECIFPTPKTRWLRKKPISSYHFPMLLGFFLPTVHLWLLVATADPQASSCVQREVLHM